MNGGRQHLSSTIQLTGEALFRVWCKKSVTILLPLKLLCREQNNTIHLQPSDDSVSRLLWCELGVYAGQCPRRQTEPVALSRLTCVHYGLEGTLRMCEEYLTTALQLRRAKTCAPFHGIGTGFRQHLLPTQLLLLFLSLLLPLSHLSY